MDLGALALMIPISAIVLGLVLRLKAQDGQDEATARQIEALRAEVAALRDTSTQFDVSLEHSVQRLDGRVSRVETKAAVPPASATAQAEETQSVGRR